MTSSSALGSYRALPALAGRTFLPIAFLGRLPFPMATLGILLVVSTSTGSVATGGLATGAASLGTASLAWLQGRLADRLGQRPVLLTASVVNATSLVLVVVATRQQVTVPLLLGACFLAGASAPQVSAFTRVRWLGLTRARPPALRAAMGYESTADEVTFVLGPALVGVLGSTGHPDVALLAAAALSLVFGTAFALHPTAAPPQERTRTRHLPLGRVLMAGWAPVAGMLAMGMFFGGMQASVTGFATQAGRPGLAGLLYAVLGVGSAVTALAVVMVPERVGLARRWFVTGSGMALAGAGTLVVTEVGALVAVLAVTGLFVGPAMVTLFTVGGHLAPRGETGTAMTLLTSSSVVGVALGATLAGRLADSGGQVPAFVLPVLASVVLAALSLGARSYTRPTAYATNISPTSTTTPSTRA